MQSNLNLSTVVAGIINCTMAAQFCKHKLKELECFIHHYRTFMFTLCVLNLVFSLVATVGNLLVVHALWKASSIPANLKKMFLSLVFSDLAVGLFVHFIYGIIMAVMLKMAANGNYNFDFLCPTVLTICVFSMFLLACASFLNITVIAVDRLLAVSLHLRYQELVTSRRVDMALVSLWLTSGIAASMLITLPKQSYVVTAVVICFGFLLSTVANIRIYKVVKYHQNRIQSQLQQANHQEMELHREKKSAFNALFVYVVFIICYLPYFVVVILSAVTNSSQIRSFLVVPKEATLSLILLNSSLNPLVYCWRYREIRQLVNSTVKKIFHITET